MKVAFYFVYILICENGAYYTGYTTDLNRRYQEHINGTASCKFTRSFKPLRIASSWQVIGDRGLAMNIERFIKKMSKKDKERLIADPHQLSTHFSCFPC